MEMRRRSALAAMITLPLDGAHAQTWPDRPVRIVVPTGAGGITDILARIVAAHLGPRLGQPVVIENRPGAGGIVGTEAAARARPDGYTLLMVFPSHPVNPSLHKKLPYDTVRDFAPISIVSTVSLVLLARPSLPAKDLSGLITLAKQQSLTYASVGNGSLGHLGAELFRSMAGISLTHVPFRGTPEAQTALLQNDVDLFFDTPITALPMVRDGKLHALGVSTREHTMVFPNVPPIADALPGYEVLGWNGILAPAGTPSGIIDRLNREIGAVLSEPEVIRQMAQQGTAPNPTTAEEFSTMISAAIDKWARVIRDAGIRPD